MTDNLHCLESFLDAIDDLLSDGLDLCGRYKAVKKRKPCIEESLQNASVDLDEIRKRIAGIEFPKPIDSGFAMQLVDRIDDDNQRRQKNLPLFSEL